MRHPRYHPNFPAGDAVTGTPFMAGTLGRNGASRGSVPPPLTVEEAGGDYSALVPPFVPPLRGPFLSGVLPRSHRARGSLIRTGREYSPPSSGFGNLHYTTRSQGIGRRRAGIGQKDRRMSNHHPKTVPARLRV